MKPSSYVILKLVILCFSGFLYGGSSSLPQGDGQELHSFSFWTGCTGYSHVKFAPLSFSLSNFSHFDLNVIQLNGLIEKTKQIVHIPAISNPVVPLDSWWTWSCLGGLDLLSAHYRFVFMPFGTIPAQVVYGAKAFFGVSIRGT